jgi:hypothetical protein
VEIDWATLPSGKTLPLDRVSAGRPGGNLAVRRHDDGKLTVRYLKRSEEPEPGEIRGVSHFASCEQASDWRRRSERIRAAQAGAPSTPEDAYKALLAMFAAHLDCPQEKVGRCVYCKAHGTRLGQGEPMTEAKRAEIRAECERLGVPVGEAPHG